MLPRRLGHHISENLARMYRTLVEQDDRHDAFLYDFIRTV